MFFSEDFALNLLGLKFGGTKVRNYFQNKVAVLRMVINEMNSNDLLEKFVLYTYILNHEPGRIKLLLLLSVVLLLLSNLTIHCHLFEFFRELFDFVFKCGIPFTKDLDSLG